MCTHTKLVFNPYINRSVRVACGRCPACIQAKAVKRANRIRNATRLGYVNLFITLTYSNDFVPYISKKSITGKSGTTYALFRDKKARRLKDGSIKVYDSTHIIDFITPDFDDMSFSLDSLKGLKNYPDRVGICYYPDLQDFFKRLKINLFRHYGFDFPLHYFACSEYGSVSQRCHFHILLQVPKSFEIPVRSAIDESWLYDSGVPKRNRIEIARNAASYVSSYVNKPSNFPPFLQASCIREKHSYSQGFGTDLPVFSLNSILEKIDKRDLRYRREVVKDGVSSLAILPIPKYVLNRYFPIFKGYSRIAPDALARILSFPEKIRYEFCKGFDFFIRFGKDSGTPYDGTKFVGYSCEPNIYFNYNDNIFPFDYGDSDYHEFLVRLNHAKEYYVRQTGKNDYDFVIDYIRVWNCYHSTLLKDSFFDSDGKLVDMSQHYENINDIDFGCVSAPTLKVDDTFERDPNKRKDIVSSTMSLTQVYHKSIKNHRLVNYCLSRQNYSV